MTTLEAQQEVITDLILEKKTEVINRKRECFKLHREIKDLSRQLDAIRGVLKADGGWIPGETLAESAARILKERERAADGAGGREMRSHWEIIGQAIREARQETEASQRTTALRLGILPSRYVAMEEGKENPNEALEKIMRLITKI